MKSDEIIRLNMFCNRVTNKEAIKFWGNDRTKYLYKNFPNEYIDYKHIENKSPEVIFLIIKNTKYFLSEYIQKEFELQIDNFVAENSINVTNKNLIKDFIYYYDQSTYKISYFFQLLLKNTNIPSGYFMRVTIKTELKPSSWIKNCIFELFEIEDGIIRFAESNNRKSYVYESDIYNTDIDIDAEINNSLLCKSKNNTMKYCKKLR